MSKFATGKYALGVSDRSGFVYKLNSMKREWTGALVGPDEWEKKQPQLDPRKHIMDPQALRNPRPTTPSVLSIYIAVPLPEDPNLRPVTGFGQVGQVTVSTDASPDVTVNLTGVAATSAVGDVNVNTPDVSTTVTGVAATSAVGSVSTLSDTFAITVANPGVGNRYYVDGVQQGTVTLKAGNTYRFDQSDSSNLNHPLRLSTTSNGTHSGGTEYTTGVVKNGVPGSSGAYTEITVADDAPTLYYYCQNHSNMGGTVNVYTEFTVTVATGTNSYGTGNKYYIGGVVSPTVSLVEESTYRFDQSDSTNLNHPLRFSTTPNGTWGGGVEYTTGVTTNGVPGNAGAYTQIVVAVGAPTLHYYCTNHSGMGGQANTP